MQLTTKRLFRESLVDKGMAETRAKSLSDAAQALHASVCQMDLINRKIFFQSFPGTLEFLNNFADREDLLKMDLTGTEIR